MKNTRREFLKVTGGLMAASSVAGAALPSVLAAENEPAMEQETATTVAPHEHSLPPLPYDYAALEPYIDEETMRLHHDKHHAAYVKGLNEAERMLAQARTEGNYEYIQHWSRKAAFNGGGHFLHTLFWSIMGPPGQSGGGEPSGALAERLAHDFGSFGLFTKQFSAAAKGVEGSGWGLLHYRLSDGALLVLQAENQQKLSAWDTVPILGVDVWEHAYYLKYRNDRGAYVDAWWNVVNWGEVGTRYERLASSKKTP